MSALPPGFEALEPFVALWSVASSDARLHLRHQTSDAERSAFYDAATPLLAAAQAYLNAKPLAALDEADTRLMNLMLALAHVSLAIEHYGRGEAFHSDHLIPITITRATAMRG